MENGSDIIVPLIAAITNAILEASPESQDEPGAHIVDMVAARGALMGVLAIVTEADPAVTDGSIVMVGRNIGEAMIRQIGAARQHYNDTGDHLWHATGITQH